MFMAEKKLPYKVETKHNLWRVFLERGIYSENKIKFYEHLSKNKYNF